MPVEQIIREPPRSFRDDLQCANYGVNRLSVGAKSFEVEFRVYETIARLAGLREQPLSLLKAFSDLESGKNHVPPWRPLPPGSSQ